MSMLVELRSYACVLAAVVITFLSDGTRPALAAGAGQEQEEQDAAQRRDGGMSVGVGRSKLIKSPLPAKTVTISDPKIADVQILSPTQLLVAGKTAGATDLVIFDAEGRAEHLEITVAADRAGALRELKRLFPDATLDVGSSRDALVVTGVLNHAQDTVRLQKYMELTGMKYVDMTTVAGVQQVQIKVVVAEANRVAIRALGINAFLNDPRAIIGAQIGPDVGGALNPISLGTGGIESPIPVSSATTLFGAFPGSDLAVFVQALAENQYLRVLAEPSMVALSGQEANFLAGGEFPIPVVQGAGATTSGTSLSIEYKKFGVQLKFRPTVAGDGTIRLHVAPEVSELSNTGAIVLQGFSIPGLLTRRAETTVEMKSGQTFGMAGLISQSTQARSSRVPGLGDLPVLGALFRSVRYRQGDTELVVLVTASLVEPLSLGKRPVLPGELHARPNDWEVYLLGRIEGEEKSRISPTDAERLQKTGLNRLRGPGAWASYDTRSSVATAASSEDEVVAPTPAPATQPARKR